MSDRTVFTKISRNKCNQPHHDYDSEFQDSRQMLTSKDDPLCQKFNTGPVEVPFFKVFFPPCQYMHSEHDECLSKPAVDSAFAGRTCSQKVKRGGKTLQDACGEVDNSSSTMPLLAQHKACKAQYQSVIAQGFGRKMYLHILRRDCARTHSPRPS